ncbi:MAG: dTDP-4-dehydrorhamnose reductase, partial [Solirubrobacteraceae bacterium]|nr:dTDP-4-dehydrorhamnose reductase [Solirubrobacteraceae bacterium]
MLVRRVLVVDGQTAIGPAMLDALARGGYDARLTTRAELEADDRRACRSALSALEPNVLIDCTADETVGLGFDAGAGNLAAATRVMGGLSVFVSDAEVFDGAAAAPYVESSTAAPATSRGATILAAEREVARANPRHALVRTSWLFGSAASGFVDDLLAAADTSDELSLDATVMSSPTYAPHLAESMLGLLR